MGTFNMSDFNTPDDLFEYISDTASLDPYTLRSYIASRAIPNEDRREMMTGPEEYEKDVSDHIRSSLREYLISTHIAADGFVYVTLRKIPTYSLFYNGGQKRGYDEVILTIRSVVPHTQSAIMYMNTDYPSTYLKMHSIIHMGSVIIAKLEPMATFNNIIKWNNRTFFDTIYNTATYKIDEETVAIDKAKLFPVYLSNTRISAEKYNDYSHLFNEIYSKIYDKIIDRLYWRNKKEVQELDCRYSLLGSIYAGSDKFASRIRKVHESYYYVPAKVYIDGFGFISFNMPSPDEITISIIPNISENTGQRIGDAITPFMNNACSSKNVQFALIHMDFKGMGNTISQQLRYGLTYDIFLLDGKITTAIRSLLNNSPNIDNIVSYSPYKLNDTDTLYGPKDIDYSKLAREKLRLYLDIPIIDKEDFHSNTRQSLEYIINNHLEYICTEYLHSHKLTTHDTVEDIHIRCDYWDDDIARFNIFISTDEIDKGDDKVEKVISDTAGTVYDKSYSTRKSLIEKIFGIGKKDPTTDKQ